MSDDIRVGDRFLVELEVLEPADASTSALCRLGGDKSRSHLIARRTLLAAKRLPRQIKPGDRVRSNHYSPATATVVAIHGEWAWIMPDPMEDGSPISVRLSALSLADEPSP